MTSPDAVRSKDSPRGVSERGRRALTDVGCVNGGMGLMGLGDGADDDEEEEGDDGDLINPNHVTKKLNISDLSAPRELSRRER